MPALAGARTDAMTTPVPGERVSSSTSPPAPTPVLLEKNLAGCGLFTASSTRVAHSLPKLVTFSEERDGTTVNTSVEIVPYPPLGLPIISDQDKWLGWLRMLLRRFGALRHVGPIVEVTTAELLDLLGHCRDSGKNYHDVREWLDVMAATTIVSNESLYLAGTRRWVRDRFRVFDRVISAGQTLDNGRITEKHIVFLPSWLRENFQHHHVLFLDFDQYRLLTRPIAKGLIPVLQAGLHAGRERGWFAKSYRATCEVLGMRHYHQRSKVLEKLGPSLDELQKAGFVAAWSIEPMADSQDLKIVLRLGPRRVHVRPPASASTGTANGEASAADAREARLTLLTNRGLHRNAAERLLKRLPADAQVEQRVASFDAYLTSHAGRNVRNKPAFLYRLLEESLSVLPTADAGGGGSTVPTTASPAAEGEPCTATVEWARRRDVLSAYEQYVQHEVAAAIEAMSEAERADRLRACEAWLRAEFRYLEHAKPDHLRAATLARLRSVVRDQTTLLSVDESANAKATHVPQLEVVQ